MITEHAFILRAFIACQAVIDVDAVAQSASEGYLLGGRKVVHISEALIALQQSRVGNLSGIESLTLITTVVSAGHSRLELTRRRHFRKWKLAEWILIFASLHHFEAMIESIIL